MVMDHEFCERRPSQGPATSTPRSWSKLWN